MFAQSDCCTDVPPPLGFMFWLLRLVLLQQHDVAVVGQATHEEILARHIHNPLDNRMEEVAVVVHVNHRLVRAMVAFGRHMLLLQRKMHDLYFPHR